MSQMTQKHVPTEGTPRITRINPRILLLALGMFALGTDAYVVVGVLPVIAHETNVTISVAGQLVTAFSLTYGLGAPLLAVLISRLAPQRVLIASLGLFCLANVASALAPNFPILMLTRILTGCFAAIYTPQAYTIGIALAPPEKRGLALALVVVGLTVATALGSPLGTWVGEHFGWRLSFGLVATVAGIGFLALLLSGMPRISTPPRVSLKQRLAPITQPHILLTLLPAFLWNLGLYTIYTYIGPFLQQSMRIVDISGMLVAFGLGIVLGSWSGGMLADRIEPKRPLIIALTFLLIIELVLPLVTATWLEGIVILFAWGISGALPVIPQQHRLLSVSTEHANVILALNNSMFYLGTAGGAVIGGIALHTIAVTQLGWIGGGCTLLAMILLFVSWQMNTHREHKQEKPRKSNTTSSD